MAAGIIASPPVADGCRIASMTAALSLSGPSSAIAMRSKFGLGCGDRQMQAASPGFRDDQFGILQCLRDM